MSLVRAFHVVCVVLGLVQVEEQGVADGRRGCPAWLHDLQVVVPPSACVWVDGGVRVYWVNKWERVYGLTGGEIGKVYGWTRGRDVSKGGALGTTQRGVIQG